MFGLNRLDLSSFSEYLDKKSRRARNRKDLLKSKMTQALNGDHVHYFSKKDVQLDKQSARCKICGKLLAEYVAEEQLKKKVSQLQTRNTSLAD